MGRGGDVPGCGRGLLILAFKQGRFVIWERWHFGSVVVGKGEPVIDG